MHGWMESQVCLLTDGSSPIGRELAVSLAKMDATVVVVSPDAARGAAAQAEIRRRSGNPRVEVLVSDLSSRDEVTEVVTDFLCDHDRLDVLVNNAELIPTQRALTIDGYESSLAVNHLAPFLLTRMLLEQLKSNGPLRIVNVTQADHARRLDLNNLNCDRTFRPRAAYAATQLMNVLFTYELARRTAGTPVTVNCVHPGASILSTAKARAQGPLFLATSPLLEGVTGKYFVKMKEAKSADVSYDPTLANQLWNLVTGCVGQSASAQPTPSTMRSRFLARNPAFS